MAKIQSFRRIIIEDYPESSRPVVAKLAGSINVFADDIVNAFNNNITIADNLASTQAVVTLTVNAAGTPSKTTPVITNLSTQCGGVQVIKAVNNTNSSHYPTATPFITFTNSGGNILINNVSGLQASESYTLTMILWPTA
jgi:hypothetical protein